MISLTFALAYGLPWNVSLLPIFIFTSDLVLAGLAFRMRRHELATRLRKTASALRHAKHLGSDSKSAMCNVAVLRDGSWVWLPENLLVAGDRIKGAGRFPSLSTHIADGVYELYETPLEAQLAEAGRLFQCSELPFTKTYRALICSLSAVASLVLLVSLAIFGPQGSAPAFQLSLPLLIAALPLYPSLAYLFTNVRLHLLAALLSSSKTPYSEAQEVDEFDEEAPPPTKDVTLGASTIANTMLRMCVRDNEALFWSVDLVKAFGTASFMVFLDRKGILTEAFKVPDQIVLPFRLRGPAQEASTAVRVAAVDRSGSAKLDLLGSSATLADLRAFGLGLALCSHCGLRSVSKDLHHGSSSLIDVVPLCPCFVAKAVGFKPTHIGEYQVCSRRHTLALQKRSGATIWAHAYTTPDYASLQLFGYGTIRDTLAFCRFHWDGTSIAAIPEAHRERLRLFCDSLDAYGVETLAISYRPLQRSADIGSHRARLNHVFLGFMTLSEHARSTVQEFVADLAAAGIRFVHFAPGSEKETKALGDRLGLETDWNSCIILSEPDVRSCTNEDCCDSDDVTRHLFSDPKSRLPRGVHNVRPHLLAVDDIPLRISLFAECSPATSAEMIRIYNEHGEVVLVLGGAYSPRNLGVFEVAPVGIAIEPALKDLIHPSVYISAQITSLFCPLRLPFEVSPYLLTDLIREARTLYRCTVSSLTFFAIAQLALFISSLLLYSIYGIACGFFGVLSCFLIPMLAFGHLLSAHEPSCMRQMPDVCITRRELVYPAIKGLANAAFAALNLFGLYALGLFAPMTSPALILAGLSASHIHLVESVRAYSPVANNRLWLSLAIGLAVFSILIDLINADLTLLNLFFSLAGGFQCLAVAEGLKLFWRRTVKTTQRRAKLEFNTRLGMHSPR